MAALQAHRATAAAAARPPRAACCTCSRAPRSHARCCTHPAAACTLLLHGPLVLP